MLHEKSSYLNKYFTLLNQFFKIYLLQKKSKYWYAVYRLIFNTAVDVWILKENIFINDYNNKTISYRSVLQHLILLLDPSNYNLNENRYYIKGFLTEIIFWPAHMHYHQFPKLVGYHGKDRQWLL